ncbi:MAG: phosphatase PAP2 family protein [Candidatus Marinimicrobia bacterium]|nr:phosphatase PAP2 family protein [Candidatus Neomarinimicrobiota bacterium]MCF7827975.1 phosphatase PAP2 family protein [Candidatus Neomarinimicrobiota bacterium]MCF7879270.1 phosphatase PAP2 family protein [Candidatus Neomarinimicrobiota bacterium]
MESLVAFFHSIDVALFRLGNTFIANPVFDVLMPFITEEEHFIIPIFLIWFGLLIFGGKRGRIAAVVLLIATGLADAVAAQIIKPVVERSRPCHEMDTLRLLVNCGGRYGFVSNHAANMFASMTVLAFFYRKIRWYLWSFAAVVAFSRVYVGVHYPGDIFFGGLFGFGMAYLFIGLLILINNGQRKRERTWLEWREDTTVL